MPALIQLEQYIVITLNQLALSSGLLLFGVRFFAVSAIFIIVGFFILSFFINWDFFRVTSKLIFIEGLLAGSLAWLFNQFIGFIYNRERPYLALENIEALIGDTVTQKSFPSDHTTVAFALAGIIYFWSPKAGIIFLILALLIGVSRIVVGIHYPSDVFVGMILGIFFAWFIHRFFI